MATYKKLLTLTFTHTYYSNGQLPQVRVQPLAETAALLKNYKLLLRRDPATGHVHLFYTALSNGSPQVQVNEGTKLTFALFIDNPHLANFTELPAKSSSKDIYVANNSNGPGNLSLQAMAVRPPVFTFLAQSNAATATLNIRDPHGREIYEQSFERAGGVYDLPVDVSTYTEGQYLFSFTPQGSDNQPSSIYISAQAARLRPFAVLELTNSGSGAFNYEAPSTYTLALATKNQQWVYHLLLGSDYTGYTIAVKDKKVTDEDIESSYPAVAFRETTGQENFEAGTQLRFKSVNAENPGADATLPLYQVPNKDLVVELNRPGGGGGGPVTKTITPLPNPQPSHLKPEIYLNI